MKILGKCLGKLSFSGILIGIFFFVDRFAISAVVSIRNINLRDELYEINKNGIHLYIGSIMLILGVFVCLIYISRKYVSNKFVFFIFTIAGIIVLAFIVNCWMDWTKILFGKYQLSGYNVIELELENTFKSNKRAKNAFTVVIIFFFILNMLFVNFEIIMKGKPYVKEAFANNSDVTDNIIFGLAIYLLWPALRLINYISLPNVIVLIIMISMVTIYFISNIVVWKRMIKFALVNKEEKETETVYIVVSENGEGHFLHELFKKEYKFVEQLYRDHIILISGNENQRIHEEGKSEISLECYTTFFAKESEIQRNHLENAIFHMAYCVEYFCDTEKLEESFYEKMIEGGSAKEAVRQIVPYCNKISYKLNLKKTLQSGQYEDKKRNNFFVRNYADMIRQLQNEIDTFQSFKILLNVLEMLNYFYTLILISYQQWSVLAIMQRQAREMTNATFGSWIELRKILLGEKQMKKIIHNSEIYNMCEHFKKMMESEMCNYELIKSLYCTIYTKDVASISNRTANHLANEYALEYKTIRLSASFEKIKDFRNSTRGHGVYTFKITENMNICLMEIAEFWFHTLSRYGFLEDDYANLIDLGWLLEYKKKMYFLYSYNKNNNELEYICFMDGTILSLPFDILGTVEK